MHTLTRKFEFAASHRLYRPEWSDAQNCQVFGKCAHQNGHGHNYRLEVTVAGPIVPETDMIVNAGALKALVEEYVLKDVDHRNLNVDVVWLRNRIPTAEALCDEIFARITAALPSLSTTAFVYRVKLWETANISVTREHYVQPTHDIK